MERLGHRIHLASEEGAWKPFKLIHGGLPITHLLFAYDLVLYAKATAAQAILIDSILQEFGHYSVHKVNKLKSHVYCSPNTSVETTNAVCSHLGIKQVPNLGVYLGMSVMHKCATCEFFSFIIDKIKSKIHGWSVRTLSFAGRITLANFVLMAIPTYFMQTCHFPSQACQDIEKLVQHFIWSSSNQTRGIPLVSWETLTQPRHNGGLGIWRLQQHNFAFHMKLCYAIASDTKKYYIKLLRQKYNAMELQPDFVMTIGCRNLGVSQNGNKSILLLKIICWSVMLLCRTIIGTGICFGKHGQFTVKSTYDLITKDLWDPKYIKWTKLRRMTIPKGIKHFLWLSYKDRLLTNVNRCAKKLTDDPLCQICGLANENTLYVLRDCQHSVALWQLIIRKQPLPNFFTTNASDWITMNLESNSLFASSNIPWKILFSSIAWQIWKRRNSYIFSYLFIHNDQLLYLCKNWSLYIIVVKTISPTDYVAARPKLIQWKVAPTDWYTLNTNEAVHKISFLGSMGGLIRNMNGGWIIGFNKPVGISTPLQDELWGIFEGLQLALSHNIECLQCQTHCVEALNLVSSPMANCIPIALVRSIANLISKQ
ncbi:hypothetical protein F3Y22_tig00112507pilonHSYRG00062 [Hibiscus syriacus]|uniref:Reverse transcriptase zinc-binding domain-containing protein n=1 Tax=Hibiscus syriacus TaxID=106335 RepID=A0A6A2WXJ3_HIBSY|nr:hypothetical protein F3Y22_tig00112507pilonHSYRG00062 [Hibiscus syriacus]